MWDVISLTKQGKNNTEPWGEIQEEQTLGKADNGITSKVAIKTQLSKSVSTRTDWDDLYSSWDIGRKVRG